MIRFLIEKEFKMIRRNTFLPRLIIILPIMMMIILPNAANLEVKNINLAVVDNDHSVYSERFIAKVGSSAYFRLVEVAPSYEQAMVGVETGNTDIILEIPCDFESQIVNKELSPILIAANAVNGTKGGVGSSYLATIAGDFAAELAIENGVNVEPKIGVAIKNRFNISMNYTSYMVPALMVMLLTIMCGFLPTLNIVSEKESGTIEQMNVSPVGKFTFILSKLIPYWIIGFVVLTLCFGVAFVGYGLTPLGSIFVIYISAAIFLLGISGLGLVISNNSQTMQQAMFVMFFFILILLLLSGLFTPVSSMPEWAQWITIFNPLKYFIQIMRGIYLKGSELNDILQQLGVLALFAMFFNTWAILSYRKKS